MPATTENPHIRRLKTTDAPLMIAFFESFSEQTRIFFTPHDISPSALEKMAGDVDTATDAVRFMLAVQEDGREVMAGYVFFWDWDRLIPWFGIGLRDAYQGKGFGNQMMDFAIRYARQNGKGGILLTTQKPNLRAQALYKKFGFEMLGEHVGGEYLMLLRFTDPQVIGMEK